jgi:hypothetical protein
VTTDDYATTTLYSRQDLPVSSITYCKRNVLGRHLWNPLAAAIYGLNLMTVNALGTLLWF